MTALQDTYKGKTTLTVPEAYEYEMKKGRLGNISLGGFRNRVDQNHYPFYKLPGSKARLVDVIDLEELNVRLRNAAKNKCFGAIK